MTDEHDQTPGASPSPPPPPVPPPVAPPTRPGALERQVHSTWPGVLGTVAIVFGVLGALSNLMGAVSPFLMGFVAQNMPPGQEGVFGAMIEWRAWIVASSVLGVAAAVLLLASGIAVVGRRPSGPLLMRVWAVAKMGIAVFGAWIGYVTQQAQFEAMAAQGQGPPAGFAGPLAYSGVVLGLLWAWALPVFVLIWFARPKIKAEAAAWR